LREGVHIGLSDVPRAILTSSVRTGRQGSLSG
jgi:hypothetical protein